MAVRITRSDWNGPTSRRFIDSYVELNFGSRRNEIAAALMGLSNADTSGGSTPQRRFEDIF